MFQLQLLFFKEQLVASMSTTFQTWIRHQKLPAHVSTSRWLNLQLGNVYWTIKMSPRKYINWSKYQWDNSFERTQNWTASMCSSYGAPKFFTTNKNLMNPPYSKGTKKHHLLPKAKTSNCPTSNQPTVFLNGIFLLDAIGASEALHP